MNSPNNKLQQVFSCAVKNCSSNSLYKGVTFYRFPRSAHRCKLWVKLCGCQDLMPTVKFLYNSKYRVCSLHFERNNTDLIPTLNLPRVTENILTTEHTYSVFSTYAQEKECPEDQEPVILQNLLVTKDTPEPSGTETKNSKITAIQTKTPVKLSPLKLSTKQTVVSTNISKQTTPLQAQPQTIILLLVPTKDTQTTPKPLSPQKKTAAVSGSPVCVRLPSLPVGNNPVALKVVPLQVANQPSTSKQFVHKPTPPRLLNRSLKVVPQTPTPPQGPPKAPPQAPPQAPPHAPPESPRPSPPKRRKLVDPEVQLGEKLLKLYRKLREEKRSVEKAQKTLLQLQKTDQYSHVKYKDFIELCDKFLPTNCASFVKIQAEIHSQTSPERVYPQELIYSALKIYMVGTKLYDEMSSIFVLPTKETMKRVIQTCDLTEGMKDCYNIFELREEI